MLAESVKNMAILFILLLFCQTGTGHFSPIGGYHVGKDMVLILDVARFKYPPHWVPLTILWDAMNTVVEDTGLHRGYVNTCSVSDRMKEIHIFITYHLVLSAKFLVITSNRLMVSQIQSSPK